MRNLNQIIPSKINLVVAVQIMIKFPFFGPS